MTPEVQAWLTGLRRELHQIPDISGDEGKTAERISQILETCTPDSLLTGIGGHGVAAVFNGNRPGPTVGIRCELDGLPIQELSHAAHASRRQGKGHLCGHDGHMAMVLGVARALGATRPRRGRVVLIFQPAEETGQGARAFRDDPAFDALVPDFLFALHNLPGLELGEVQLCRGPANCASRGMRIGLTGKTAHAAAPHEGRSPAAALAALMPALAALGADGPLVDAYALTTVTHAKLGAETFGVSPGHAELWVTLRTVSDARMARLIEDAQSLVGQVANKENLSFSISFEDIFTSCANDPQAVQLLSSACHAQGVTCRLSDQPQKFSEDFGQFSTGSKTAMFWLGAGRTHSKLHNPDYDFPDELIPVGTGIFLSAIDAVLGHPS